MLDADRERARAAHQLAYDFIREHLTDEERLDALGAAMAQLEQDFGRWRLAWGEVNRFQRLTGDIVQPFDDRKPSLPVGLAPGQWGALASFDSSKPRSTKRIYGSTGNSFVAAVEFGPTVRAKAHHDGRRERRSRPRRTSPIRRRCTARDAFGTCGSAPKM